MVPVFVYDVWCFGCLEMFSDVCMFISFGGASVSTFTRDILKVLQSVVALVWRGECFYIYEGHFESTAKCRRPCLFLVLDIFDNVKCSKWHKPL